MKVSKPEEDQVPMKSAHATQIREGDRVVAKVVHEIVIDGDKAWVTFEAGSNVGEGEDGDEAATRIIDFVTNKVHDAVKATVDTTAERMDR